MVEQRIRERTKAWPWQISDLAFTIALSYAWFSVLALINNGNQLCYFYTRPRKQSKHIPFYGRNKRIFFYGQTNVLCILLYILGRNDSEKDHMIWFRQIGLSFEGIASTRLRIRIYLGQDQTSYLQKMVSKDAPGQLSSFIVASTWLWSRPFGTHSPVRGIQSTLKQQLSFNPYEYCSFQATMIQFCEILRNARVSHPSLAMKWNFLVLGHNPLLL